MTQLHPESQLRRPSISVFSDTVDWQTRPDVNIYFDNNQSFFDNDMFNLEKIEEYVKNTRTCQRIVLIVPRSSTSKILFYNTCKKLLEIAQKLLDEDKSIDEIVVACYEHRYKQFLLKKAASYIWTKLKSKQLTNNDEFSLYDFPSPETYG